jgi:hypothetical protein
LITKASLSKESDAFFMLYEIAQIHLAVSLCFRTSKTRIGKQFPAGVARFYLKKFLHYDIL